MVAVGIQPTETRAIQNLVVLISGQIRKLRLREETPTLAQGHWGCESWSVLPLPHQGLLGLGRGWRASTRCQSGCQFYQGGKLAEREVTQPNAGETLS